MVKLDKNDVREIRKLTSKKKYTDSQIAEMFNVSRGHICKIKNNKRWNNNEYYR